MRGSNRFNGYFLPVRAKTLTMNVSFLPASSGPKNAFSLNKKICVLISYGYRFCNWLARRLLLDIYDAERRI
jgi:hypothetical protein